MERSMELSKFMGSWYVIANIPTPFEKNAYNAMETYSVSLCNAA
jgi:apolipoprotein D and lipocalin family protein